MAMPLFILLVVKRMDLWTNVVCAWGTVFWWRFMISQVTSRFALGMWRSIMFFLSSGLVLFLCRYHLG